jgi:hypothetical protein
MFKILLLFTYISSFFINSNTNNIKINTCFNTDTDIINEYNNLCYNELILPSSVGDTAVNISWINYDSFEIDFSISAKTKGWLSLGFPRKSGQMIDSDSVIAYYNEKGIIDYKAYYINSYSSDDISPQYEKPKNYVENVYIKQNNDIMELQFKIKNLTIYKNKYLDIIWAVNQLPPIDWIWEHDSYGSTTLDIYSGKFINNTIIYNYKYSIIISIIIFINMLIIPIVFNKILKYKFFKNLQNRRICKPNYFVDLKWTEFGVLFIILSLSIFYIVISYYKLFSYSLNFTQSTGYISSAILTLTTIPITRTNILVYLFGNSYDRSIKIHKILGYLYILMILLHFIIVLYKYGFNITFSFEKTSKGVIPIYGTIGFICSVLIGITSIKFIRRNYFQLFYNTHMLFLIVFITIILHYIYIGYFYIFPIIFYGVSIINRIKNILLRDKLLNVRIIEKNILCLEIKYNKINVKGGQYVFLNIPSVSITEWHPFSISSIDYEKKIFTLHIKVNGDWTKKVFDKFNNKINEKTSNIIISTSFSNVSDNIYIEGPYVLK